MIQGKGMNRKLQLPCNTLVEVSDPASSAGQATTVMPSVHLPVTKKKSGSFNIQQHGEKQFHRLYQDILP